MIMKLIVNRQSTILKEKSSYKCKTQIALENEQDWYLRGYGNGKSGTEIFECV